MDTLRPAIRPAPAFSPYGPHPTGGGVVGTYVQHSYELSRQPYQIPSMRPGEDGPSGYSATPIYDALYSEYRRSFRALPGDRTGEEDLRFRGFGAIAAAHGFGSSHTSHTSGQVYPTQYGGHTAARHTGQVQAALPPAPRRGQ